MNPKTLSLLEYDKILARLKSYCAFSASVSLAENLKPTPSIKKAKTRLEETSEARLLFSTHETIGVDGARDVRGVVKLASRGGVPETQNLLDIKSFRSVFLNSHKNYYSIKCEFLPLASQSPQKNALL